MSLCYVFKLCLFTLLYLLVKRAKAQLPSLDEHPADTIGYAGGSVTFECSVRNLNGYNLIWAKRRQDGSISYISRNWDVFYDNPKYLVHNDEGEPSFALEIFNLEMGDEASYECRYESGNSNALLGSGTLTVISLEPSPICQYVTVPSVDENVCDLNCVWLSNTSNPSAEIFKNGQLVPIDFRLSDRVISRQSLDRLDQLNAFECRWTSPTTGQTSNCRYQQSTQAPIMLGVEPYMNGVVVGQTARFECQAEMVASFSNQEIAYSWSITRKGHDVDLGERQKGLMKQSMRILSAELADDGLTVMCTAASSMGEVVHGAGLLTVYLPTSTSTQPTSKSVTIRVGSSIAPRKDEPLLNTTIISVIAVLLLLILILVVVIIILARSKTRREKWIALGRSMSFKKNRPKRYPRLDEAYLRGDNEMVYPDQNPDIICAHSTLPPIYAMPDKLRKSNTMDGGARHPPRHYTPRRQSYGGAEFKETEFIDQTSDMKASEKYPNPYEDIDDDAVNDAKQMRSKSHTVSQCYRDSHPSPVSGSPRRYRGMKSAGSTSMLYGKPEKPQRNPKGLSLKSRKSWDQPGSIENLCNYAVSDTRSIKSFTGSICDGDSYAYVEENTVTSEYMDMNPVLNDSTLDDLNNVTRESEISGYDEPPLYAQIN